jgi:hypothetical protein
MDDDYFCSIEDGNKERVQFTPLQLSPVVLGAGIENHSKYAEQIYSHGDHGELFVNLFIPSVVTWKEQGLVLNRKQIFPESILRFLLIWVYASKTFTLLIRTRIIGQRGKNEIFS